MRLLCIRVIVSSIHRAAGLVAAFDCLYYSLLLQSRKQRHEWVTPWHVKRSLNLLVGLGQGYQSVATGLLLNIDSIATPLPPASGCCSSNNTLRFGSEASSSLMRYLEKFNIRTTSYYVDVVDFYTVWEDIKVFVVNWSSRAGIIRAVQHHLKWDARGISNILLSTTKISV